MLKSNLENDDNIKELIREFKELKSRVSFLEKKIKRMRPGTESEFTDCEKLKLIGILNKNGTRAAQEAASRMAGREVSMTLVPQYKRRMRLLKLKRMRENEIQD